MVGKQKIRIPQARNARKVTITIEHTIESTFFEVDKEVYAILSILFISVEKVAQEAKELPREFNNSQSDGD